MFLDVMNQENYISFNITLAKIIGLEGAVYCSELLSVYNKAKEKKKIIGDEFFKLDRTYMLNRTTLSIEKQLELDAKWEAIKLIYKDKNNPDILKIDTQLLASIIAEEDIKVKEDLSKFLNSNISSIKATKHKRRIDTLKAEIKCENQDILAALRKWVDVMSERSGKSKISAESIEIFQDTLYRYTNGDVEQALSIIKIATIQKYIDCQWAINLYEKDKKMRVNSITKRPQAASKTELQKVATKDTVGTEIF